MRFHRPTHQLVGNYRNAGSDYRPKGEPIRVKVHDFEDKELGKVVPHSLTFSALTLAPRGPIPDITKELLNLGCRHANARPVI